jgi:amino acid permease
MEVPVLIPQNRASLRGSTSDQAIQMSSLGVDQDIRARHGNSSTESIEEGTEPTFHLRQEEPATPEQRAKEFKARHIQMMALGKLRLMGVDLGGAIGAGLLFQSGKALYQGGPVSLWLAYLLMGTVSYAVLVCPSLQAANADYSR